jgi:hypothetical protein
VLDTANENIQTAPAENPGKTDSNYKAADSSLPPLPSSYPCADSLGIGTEIDSEQSSSAEHLSSTSSQRALPPDSVHCMTAGVIETNRFAGSTSHETGSSADGNCFYFRGPAKQSCSGKGASSAESSSAESVCTVPSRCAATCCILLIRLGEQTLQRPV